MDYRSFEQIISGDESSKESDSDSINDYTETNVDVTEVSSRLQSSNLKKKENSKKRKVDETSESNASNENTIIASYVKCFGLKCEISENLHCHLATHLIELEKYKFVIENNKFHSVRCCENNYVYVKNKESNSISLDCYNIKYNEYYKNMLRRATSQLDIHINHKYMSYTQLDMKLQDNAEKLNALKLEMLNKDYKLISQQNKIDLFKRFNILITNNDVPRLRQ